MKFCLATIFLGLAAFLHAEIAGVAPNDKFEINHKFGDPWIETIKFSDTKLPSIHLEGFPWSGFYLISPDSKWILRIQKTGSGDNLGFLYQVESSGRVSQVIGFNDSLWNFSDFHSRLKADALYHSGIESAEWSKDSHLLTLILRGSNAQKNGDGIQHKISYNLRNHTFGYLE